MSNAATQQASSLDEADGQVALCRFPSLLEYCNIKMENTFLGFLIQLNRFYIFRSVVGCRADAVLRAWALRVRQQGRDNVIVPSRHRETVVHHIFGTGEHSIASYCWFITAHPFWSCSQTPGFESWTMFSTTSIITNKPTNVSNYTGSSWFSQCSDETIGCYVFTSEI